MGKIVDEYDLRPTLDDADTFIRDSIVIPASHPFQIGGECGDPLGPVSRGSRSRLARPGRHVGPLFEHCVGLADAALQPKYTRSRPRACLQFIDSVVHQR